jgi:hypothetical protein
MPPFDKLHVTILTHLFTRTTDFATLSHFNDFAAATALLSSFFEALTHQGRICIILPKKQVFLKISYCNHKSVDVKYTYL